MEEYSAMKTRFDEEIYRLKLSKGKNTQLYTIHEYYSLLNKVQIAKNKTAHKTPEDYQRLSRYDIIMIGTVQRLIVPVKNETEPIQYYCFLEETFDIIHQTHISIGHGGRNKMMKELKQRFKNITKEFVALYLSFCEQCQKRLNVSLHDEKFNGHCLNQEKSSATKQKEEVRLESGEEVVKLESGEEEEVKLERGKFYSRCQVDLIDMQSRADGEFMFIMVYQDHHTKFVILRPLKSDPFKEVADHLLDIFTTFGPPSILTSDDGEEFAKKVIIAVHQMWNEVKIIYVPNGESAGPVERANIEKMLFTWMETNKTTKWSEGLKFIQLTKNKAYHSGINRSPYDAMFGSKTQVRSNVLQSLVLPTFNGTIKSEEEMDTTLEDENSGVCRKAQVESKVLKSSVLPAFNGKIENEEEMETTLEYENSGV